MKAKKKRTVNVEMVKKIWYGNGKWASEGGRKKDTLGTIEDF